MYRYLAIRSDEACSRHLDSAEITRLLASMPELRQTGPSIFEASPGMPWTSVVLAMANSNGGYAVNDTPQPSINLIELVCSWIEDASWHEALACRIAAALNWQAIEEHEDRHLWPPDGPHA